MQHARPPCRPRGSTSRMLTMLHGFAGSRGTVTLAVRSRGGIEYPRLELTLPVTVLPSPGCSTRCTMAYPSACALCLGRAGGHGISVSPSSSISSRI